MDGPRAAKVEELPLVENLSNKVFRTRDDDGQTMFQEFPDLFSRENIENIRIIVEDGKPVSNINYLIRPVTIYGSTVKVASLGAVATLDGYRGRGYASILLGDCINRMMKQGVHVLLISGDRKLYRNIGSVPAGLMYNYFLSSENVGTNKNIGFSDTENYSIKEINIDEISSSENINEDMGKIVKLYRQESVRFVRKKDEFIDLLKSRKFLRKITDQKKIIAVEGQDGFEAYMYLGVDGKNGSIYDCAGSRELIIKTCAKLINDKSLDSVYGRVLPQHQSAIRFCKSNNIKLEERRLIGTIAIIDFAKFMKSLKQYFYENYDNKCVDKFEFINDQKGACFKFGDKKCIVRNNEKLNDLIFGGAQINNEDFILESTSGDNLLKSEFKYFEEFFSQVFPIHFIDPYSLNYI